MHVVGARFMSLEAAVAAMHVIRASVAVEPSDVAVRPLGTTRYDRPIEAYLLAGRFQEADADTVVRIAEDHGGRVISRRAEVAAHRVTAAPARAPNKLGASGSGRRERASRDRDARRLCWGRGGRRQ